jgi:ABC-2 type transport system permease protein
VRALLAVLRKELSVYFTTPLAWVVLMVVAFFSAQFFTGALDAWRFLSLRALQAQSAGTLERMNLTDLVVARLFGSVALFLVVTAPFLTMRLVAEERRERTFELLMTAPVRPAAIVLGKYLAALVVLAAALALVGAYPVLLSAVAEGAEGGPAVEWPTVASGLLGLFLLGSAALAVGLFFSAATDTPVVAALLSLVVLLGLWTATQFTVGVEGPARDLALALSASEHLAPFLQGRIVLSDVLYYLSLSALGLWLADRTVEANRWA